MSDTAVTNDTTVTEAPKKRGRKKISEGGTPSPKKVFCICAAKIDDDLVVEEIYCVESDKNTSDEDVRQEAKDIFTNNYNEEPSEIFGPYFQRKGGKVTVKSDKVSYLSLETASLEPGKLGTAVYKDWHVSVRFVQNYPSDVYIMYKTHTKEEKKTKPQNKFVKIGSLKSLEISGADNSIDA